MLKLFANPYARLALAALAGAAGLAAVFVYAERQGALRASVKLNEQTELVIEEISNAAEKTRALRRYCIGSERVWNFGSNRCQDAAPDKPRP